jgi:hypothetical protein
MSTNRTTKLKATSHKPASSQVPNNQSILASAADGTVVANLTNKRLMSLNDQVQLFERDKLVGAYHISNIEKERIR